ncbi:SurA N-terminal domain-containing protein [Lysobacter sp. SG-8]|uniref:Periplasmic chaperone PpiD n=1 Tax=Marilutibacter penaei TaxID=2759900 RepID=A0A7W3YF87_9GAMM|nr:SurA N-terminal domain-containing protein [Lysobacter penaei]MBB1089070.1 SurA N-terminal domain-containing protein [Lysobacter penaei]
MLQKLREKSSGLLGTIVIAILIVPLALFGIDQYLVQGGNSTAARIEAPPRWWPAAPSWWPASMLWQEEVITVQEFSQAFDQERSQRRAQQGDAFDPRAFESLDSKREVLEKLVDQRVLKIAAYDDGVVASDALVRSTIQDIPAFQVDGSFDAQRYQMALASQAQTPKQFEATIRDGLQVTLVPVGVQDSSFVTRAEMERLVRLIGERRDVQLLLVPPAEDTAAVSDADAQAWYEAHPEDFLSQETVTIEYVDVDARNLPAPAAASEAVLRARYEDEKARFVEPEERLASHILIEVPADADDAARKAAEDKARALASEARADGADFAALAQANSDDAGSADMGGDLGWVGKDMMVAPFEEALFGMAAPGVSEPVETEFGWHVIQLREIKAGAQEPFEQVRDTLAREQAEADRASAANELVTRVVDQIYKNPNDLSGVASATGLDVQTVGPVARDASDGVLAFPAVKREAFDEVLIQDGTISDPVEIEAGRHVVLRVTAHQASSTQPLDAVRETVDAAVRADRARKAARRQGAALLGRLKAGETLASVAESKGLAEPNPIPGLQRGMPVPNEAINRAMFAAQAPSGEAPTPGMEVMEDGTIALFVIEAVTPGDDTAINAAQSEMLKGQLEQVRGYDDAQAYTRSQRLRMQVRVFEENL